MIKEFSYPKTSRSALKAMIIALIIVLIFSSFLIIHEVFLSEYTNVLTISLCSLMFVSLLSFGIFSAKFLNKETYKISLSGITVVNKDKTETFIYWSEIGKVIDHTGDITLYSSSGKKLLGISLELNEVETFCEMIINNINIPLRYKFFPSISQTCILAFILILSLAITTDMTLTGSYNDIGMVLSFYFITIFILIFFLADFKIFTLENDSLIIRNVFKKSTIPYHEINSIKYKLRTLGKGGQALGLIIRLKEKPDISIKNIHNGVLLFAVSLIERKGKYTHQNKT